MKKLVSKSRKYLFFLIIVFLSANSCNKVQDSLIPDVPFSFSINLNINNGLMIPGNSEFFPKIGFGGVIVYCEIPGTYYAYDAGCTNEISKTCLIENEGVLGTCSCCGSQFLLTGGAYPAKGPAAAPLKQYQVIVNGSTLRVYN